MIASINNYIQCRLQSENKAEISLPQAAFWLDEVNILKDTKSSRGYSLRRHVKRGNVFGVYKKRNYFWYIRRIENYQPILGVRDLGEVFKLKSRTSLYKKIQEESIPFVKKNKKGIYFREHDIIRWAIEKNRMDIIPRIKKKNKEKQQFCGNDRSDEKY